MDPTQEEIELWMRLNPDRTGFIIGGTQYSRAGSDPSNAYFDIGAFRQDLAEMYGQQPGTYPGAPNVPEYIETAPPPPFSPRPSQAIRQAEALEQEGWTPPPATASNAISYKPIKIPAKFRAFVGPGEGKGHGVFVGQRLLATFVRRRAAHDWKNLWNNLIDRLGCVKGVFYIPNLVKVFQWSLTQASGQEGANNHFVPPLRGLGGPEGEGVAREGMTYYVDENGGNNLGIEDAGRFGENLKVGQDSEAGRIAKIYTHIQTGNPGSGMANFVAVDVVNE
ncbi:MAG: hypothetical protein WCA89_12240 [Terracidiphilus sp.]